jgi:serine/threonine protein kinase
MPDMLPLRETDPREVGGYRLLGRLGEGGQGVVFLAVSPDESQVAVKLLPPTTNPQVRSRFLKEVAAAQRVARFSTAQVIDAGIFERRPFIVSEYVSGPSLVEVVEQFGPHAGAALERIAIATLTALGAVHAVGMVHRDFKPGNVLLGPDGPVVIDFGLAAVPGMTTTGMSGQIAIVTPAYMAPEQLAGERVTAAADMWSWAVTMAYAGTGELPFKGDSLTATAYAILHAEPQVGRLPQPLGLLVRRCLNKDADLRPSARSALSELVAAGARLDGPMPPRPRADISDGLISGGLSPRPRRRRHGNGRASPRWRVGALVILILLAASAGGLALTHFRQGPESERGASLERPTASATPTNQLGVEEALRARVVTWVMSQVSSAAGVSCDAQMCEALSHAGFASSSLQVLNSASTDPLDSNLVVATATIRNQFGGLLDVDAPALIATFGTGDTRIEIRWVYPGGSAAYKAALPTMLRQRKTAYDQLLNNGQLKLSATARAQLRNGQVDPRLPPLVVVMAHTHPLRIVDFSSLSPGGGPASLLRWVDLATTAQAAQAAHLTRAAYISWMRSSLSQQLAPYHPDWYQQIKLPTGETVLRVGFGAPSQLNPLP